MARTTRTASVTTTAVGYIRVSTDKQADHGVSLDAQKARLEAYATLYELMLVDISCVGRQSLGSGRGADAERLYDPDMQQAQIA
jgi:DNA invertase Pin-like site-specific DNA recombinase